MRKLVLLLFLLVAPSISSAEEAIEETAGESVTLEVTPTEGAQIEGQRIYHYNFGHVYVGERRRADFFLSAGAFPLRVRGMSVWGPYYNASTNCPNVLLPRQTCTIRVHYWPGSPGIHHGQLNVFAGNDRLRVRLHGAAHRF